MEERGPPSSNKLKTQPQLQIRKKKKKRSGKKYQMKNNRRKLHNANSEGIPIRDGCTLGQEWP